MVEEIKINNETPCGLVSKQYICVEASQYDTESDSRILLPFTKCGKYGLMDKSRNVVLRADYDIIIDSAYTAEDLIRVGCFYYVNNGNNNSSEFYRRSMVGVINVDGEFIIPMEYKSIILPDRSNMFSVGQKGSYRKGVIDINNNIVVPFGRYDYIDGFSRGYARVKNEAGKWGIIDETGTEILPCIYTDIWNFYEKDYPTAIVVTEDGCQGRFHFEDAALQFHAKTLTPRNNLWPTVKILDDEDLDTVQES